MAKTTPIITHTEILCYAIRHIEAEITEWNSKAQKAPDEYRQMIIDMAKSNIDQLQAKLDALKALYHIETGKPYC